MQLQKFRGFARALLVAHPCAKSIGQHASRSAERTKFESKIFAKADTRHSQMLKPSSAA